MKKVRSFINVALGSAIAALGLNSCDSQTVVLEKYGVPYMDTTVRCLYGVPSPQPVQWDENPDTAR